MPDWTKSMQQTFEYYTVDPGTWKDVKPLTNVTSCSITRDLDVATLGSATIDATESLGECYVRIYLVTIQNGLRERFPLGTFLVQTPSVSFDGKVRTISMDAYTPLLELKENPPPLGYSLLEGDDIMEKAYLLCREHARAPVVSTNGVLKQVVTKDDGSESVVEEDALLSYDFVANTDDTWLTFISDLIANAKYQFDLDELGRIIFAPKQDVASLQPVWTFNDDNSSILLPDITINRDLYDIPNAYEVIYSNGKKSFYSKAVNDDPNSPISTVSRGREILRRDMEPKLAGNTTQYLVDEYAKQKLRELSSVECTVSYSHGYCPVRVGDCVRLNYTRAGLLDTKAKVVSQDISCKTACQVSEKAVFTTKLWG